MAAQSRQAGAPATMAICHLNLDLVRRAMLHLAGSVTTWFQPFNPHADVEITHRNLPHWQQAGATYFVTFRLADSLPAEVQARLEEMQRLNEAATFAWIDRYLDAGSGSCLFRNPRLAGVVANSLRYFNGDRYRLDAFVIMPNHVHALVSPILPDTLTAVVHSWKSYTAHQLQRSSGIVGKVWQEESFDRLVRDENELKKFQEYIAQNPVKANLKHGSYILGSCSP